MNKKILFIISSLNTGGAQSAMANMSIALSDLYDIDWLVNSDDKIAYEYKGSLISLGLHEPEDRDDLSYQAKSFFRRLKAIKKLKKSGEYVAALSFLESANLANVLTGKHGVRVIVSQRSTASQRRKTFKNKLKTAINRLTYNRADAVVAISNGVRKDLIDNQKVSADKAITILNGYNLDAIEKSIQEPCDFTKEEGTFTFANMGRLHEAKGQWHLIRAFSKVYKECPKARLLILGSGGEDEFLQKLVAGYKLQEVVKMLPYRTNPFSPLSKCDAFVFPSLYEGFGNALCEAMICGLPVISSDYRYGAREIVAPNTDVEIQTFDEIEYAQYGVLVPVCSGERLNETVPLQKEEEMLYEAMKNMLSDTDVFEKYKEQSKERAAQLSLENKSREWDAVIRG